MAKFQNCLPGKASMGDCGVKRWERFYCRPHYGIR